MLKIRDIKNIKSRLTEINTYQTPEVKKLPHIQV